MITSVMVPRAAAPKPIRRRSNGLRTRAEIVAEMSARGEQHTLNDVCLAVAVVADVISCAQQQAAVDN